MRGLGAGLLTFLVYLGLQVTIFHFIRVPRRALVLAGLWVAVLPLYAALYAVTLDDAAVWPSPLVAPSDAVTFLNGGVLYFFLFMGYAYFFYIAESSVGVRTMIELASQPEKGLTLEEVTGRYRYDWMLDRRLHRMVRAGYLVEEDGWYRTTQTGRLAAGVSSWCKKFLRLGPGG